MTPRATREQNADPFYITGPAIISFSGGRTSGLMLHNILAAHGGELPVDVIPCFQNTGKERQETLDFVHAVSERWTPITWLEWRRSPETKTSGAFDVVTYETAARNGEPFAALIDARGMLPNPVARFCSAELKIKTMQRFARSIGFDDWSNVIGLRADEPRRVSKMRNKPDLRAGMADVLMPLADAGITKRHVKAFWDAHNFDLELPNINGVTPLGNCDLCHLKSLPTLLGIIRDYPGSERWWIDQESVSRPSKKDGGRFRNDRMTYAQMAAFVRDQGDMVAAMNDDESGMPCFCHD